VSNYTSDACPANFNRDRDIAPASSYMFFVKIEFNEVIELSAICSTQIKFLREIEIPIRKKY